ncbi:Polysaccharide deacetylase [Halogranum amylolyticum]|uniref:Polysaccharide deacetylase n=2 Tax=Halogranum amylolyticum TaxID=660520 RepID=A0A1H8V7D2_9EURY|nr:Polysaccharide deacetylase [Halogranum amylolyticum]
MGGNSNAEETAAPTESTTTEMTAHQTETTETSTPEPSQSDDFGSPQPMKPTAASFEDLSFWQAHANVNLTADKETVYTGSQSARIENSSGTIVWEFPVPVDLSNKDISLAVKLDKPEPTNLRIWFTDTAGNEIRLIQQLNQNHPNTWMRVNPSINSVDGDLGAIESMLITLDGDGAGKRYWLDDIRFHQKQTKTGQVMLSFDDISISIYEDIFPIMQEYDLKGVVAVPPDIIGNDNRMNQEQLDELKKAGWEFASHGNDLQALYGLRRSAQKKKIERAKRLIKERGLGDPIAFMYPGGGCDKHTVELVREHHNLGYLAFKGSEKGLSQSALMGPMFVNRSRPNTPEAVANQLEVAHAYRGMYNLYLHLVGDDAENSTSDFREMCEHIATYRKQGKIEVVQPSDVVLSE